jgi:hypothetical protein
MNGVAYLAGQLVVPLVLATLAGVLIGHFAWPRRGLAAVPRPAAPPATPPAPEPPAAPPDQVPPDADLAAARDEASALRSALARLTDQKDAEIGRLETGAIQAMESTMASSRERIADLERRLQESVDQCRTLEVRLQSEQGRTARLEASLVERDRRILELSAPPRPPS